MTDDSRFDPKALVVHIAIALLVGGAIAYFTDAKAYLVAHRQEQADESEELYRYKFPFPALTEKKE